jgi:hypothetical protein
MDMSKYTHTHTYMSLQNTSAHEITSVLLCTILSDAFNFVLFHNMIYNLQLNIKQKVKNKLWYTHMHLQYVCISMISHTIHTCTHAHTMPIPYYTFKEMQKVIGILYSRE